MTLHFAHGAWDHVRIYLNLDRTIRLELESEGWDEAKATLEKNLKEE